MIKRPALFATFVVLVSACADQPPVPLSIDLSDYDISSATRDADGIELFDASGTQLGRVVVEDHRLEVTLGAASGSLAWDDRSASATCNGSTAVIAAMTGGAWELMNPDGATLADCGVAFNVAESVGDAVGTHLPWRHDEQTPVDPSAFWDEGIVIEQQACVASSTWQFASTCATCFDRLCERTFGAGGSYQCNTSGTSSCSVGIVYTTCSATYCN